MLFQKNIVKKYINMLNEEQILKPWEQYHGLSEEEREIVMGNKHQYLNHN